MIPMDEWVDLFLEALDKTFGARVWFVGLQGSYGCGEAMESSDIDMVVILDEVSIEDFHTYRIMLDALSHREKMCGFMSGKSELLHWLPADLFQFYYDTKALRGSLDALLPRIDAAAVDRAIQTGACHIYHGCVHNILYDQSDAVLRDLYKSAVFVLQAVYFKRTSTYIKSHKELWAVLPAEEKRILQTHLDLKNGGFIVFHDMSEALLDWSKKWIERIG